MEERRNNRNLEKLVQKLDITKSMAENAESKYKAVVSLLQENGIDVDIYPQGSFAIGTVVRPYTRGKEVDYDLDFICEVSQEKSSTTPKDIKQSIGDILKSSGKPMKDEDDTCWTLDYANIQDNIGFNLDIVPAVHEEKEVINSLIMRGVPYIYAKDAVAITIRRTQEKYDWGYGNAKGYTNWFNQINEPYKNYRKEERKRLFEANIAPLPDISEKSSLQMVIQILKRHRDVYFYRTNSKYKISSSIITTIVAQIAKLTTPKGLLELLEFVVNELYVYTRLINEQQQFLEENPNRLTIKKSGKEWIIPNPVNPENNLARDWTDETAMYFFKWIEEVKEDLIVSKDYDDEKYLISLKNGFGESIVEKSMNDLGINTIKRIPVNVSNTKPYRGNVDEE